MAYPTVPTDDGVSRWVGGSIIAVCGIVAARPMGVKRGVRDENRRVLASWYERCGASRTEANADVWCVRGREEQWHDR